MYARLQLNLTRGSEDGTALVEQLLDVVGRELDQSYTSTVSILRNDANKEEKFGTLTSSQHELVQLQPWFFYRFCGLSGILLGLHSEGFLCGCLGMSCLRLDKFRRVYVDSSELVIMGRKLTKCISKAVKCTEKIGDLQPDEVIESISKIGVLVSPELLFELLRNEGVSIGRSDLKYTPNTSSDVWAFSCVIIRLLAGKQFTEDIFKYLSVLFQMRDGEPGYECKTLFMNWTEREDKMLEASIGAKFMSVKQTLVKCLDFNLQSRPHLMDVWRVFRESSAKSCLDEIVSLKETTDHCFVLSELWGISDECKSDLKMDQLQEGCSDSV